MHARSRGRSTHLDVRTHGLLSVLRDRLRGLKCGLGSARHSRYLVYEDTLNRIEGYVLIRELKSGTLRLGYQDPAGAHQVSITPESPLVLELSTRLHRKSRSFTLFFEPQGREVEGLAG